MRDTTSTQLSPSEIQPKQENLERAKRHKSFLYIIAMISMFTLAFEWGLFLLSGQNYCVQQKWWFGFSVGLLVLNIFIALIYAGEGKVDVWAPIDNLFAKVTSGQAVTTVFFGFLLSNVLFIMQDGGANSSCLTDLLLINISFGFFFAEKKKIKVAVVVGCLLAYIACCTYYYDASVSKFSFHEIYTSIPFILMTVFVVFINMIIEYQMNKHRQRIV